MSFQTLVYRDNQLWEELGSGVHRYPHTGYRPSKCCQLCGNSYALVGDRCIKGRLGMKAEWDLLYNPEAGDPFLLNIENCCYFCGTKPNSYYWNQKETKCVPTEVKFHENTYLELLCYMCKFITHYIKNIRPKRLNVSPEDRSMCAAFTDFRNECENYMTSQFTKIVSFTFLH